MFSMTCAAGILGFPETPKGIVCKAGNPPLFKASKSRSWIKRNRRVGRYESYIGLLPSFRLRAGCLWTLADLWIRMWAG